MTALALVTVAWAAVTIASLNPDLVLPLTRGPSRDDPSALLRRVPQVR